MSQIKIHVSADRDPEQLAEDYRFLGWNVEVDGTELSLYWGKKKKPKEKKDQEEKKQPARRSRDENRLRGRQG